MESKINIWLTSRFPSNPPIIIPFENAQRNAIKIISFCFIPFFFLPLGLRTQDQNSLHNLDIHMTLWLPFAFNWKCSNVSLLLLPWQAFVWKVARKNRYKHHDCCLLDPNFYAFSVFIIPILCQKQPHLDMHQGSCLTQHLSLWLIAHSQTDLTLALIC